MSTTLKEALALAGLKSTEEVLTQEEENGVKHASKDRRIKVVERPDKEVSLESLAEEVKEYVKTQKDPTDDLVFLPRGVETTTPMPAMGKGYIVYCNDTEETWYAPDKHCLDANFIYRLDIKIDEVDDEAQALEVWKSYNKELLPGIQTSKVCYILDDPGNETYEVYKDSSYPSRAYGKATPTGMAIHRYPNRFHRDMAIMELDNLYTESSNKAASKLTSKKLGFKEAIVISDGAWMKETSSCCCYYLDNTSVIKIADSTIPTEPTQAVLISEVRGAMNALSLCYAKGKTNITYYYDNTSILNVFRNRKTEYIDEIKEYKEMLAKMDREGFNINFVEIHPKTDENRDSENKALMFFHNSCDAECRVMCDLVKKDYKSFATNGSKDGTSYEKVKKEYAPKPKGNYNKGGYGGNNNYNKGPRR